MSTTDGGSTFRLASFQFGGVTVNTPVPYGEQHNKDAIKNQREFSIDKVTLLVLGRVIEARVFTRCCRPLAL